MALNLLHHIVGTRLKSCNLTVYWWVRNQLDATIAVLVLLYATLNEVLCVVVCRWNQLFVVASDCLAFLGHCWRCETDCCDYSGNECLLHEISSRLTFTYQKLTLNKLAAAIGKTGFFCTRLTKTLYFTCIWEIM